MTGDIRSLRVLKDRLEKVIIHCCPNVEGNLMDLADFPHLEQLDLHKTAVTGDIRDIGCNDFSQMEYLDLPKSVNGATLCGIRHRRKRNTIDYCSELPTKT